MIPRVICSHFTRQLSLRSGLHRHYISRLIPNVRILIWLYFSVLYSYNTEHLYHLFAVLAIMLLSAPCNMLYVFCLNWSGKQYRSNYLVAIGISFSSTEICLMSHISLAQIKTF